MGEPWRRARLHGMPVRHVCCAAAPRTVLASPLVPCCCTGPAVLLYCRGLLYCMEYLEDNLEEWLGEELEVRAGHARAAAPPCARGEEGRGRTHAAKPQHAGPLAGALCTEGDGHPSPSKPAGGWLVLTAAPAPRGPVTTLPASVGPASCAAGLRRGGLPGV